MNESNLHDFVVFYYDAYGDDKSTRVRAVDKSAAASYVERTSGGGEKVTVIHVDSPDEIKDQIKEQMNAEPAE